MTDRAKLPEQHKLFGANHTDKPDTLRVADETPAAFRLHREKAMKGPIKERWMELCEQAMKEQDPEQFMKLMREINELLEAKAERIVTGDTSNVPNRPCPE